MDERITIMHGPNGFGKTMMLKLLHAIFGHNDRFLREIPFDEFRIEFEDATSFWVSKEPSSGEISEEEGMLDEAIYFYATGKEKFPLPGRIPAEKVSEPMQIAQLKHFIAALDRAGSDVSWHNVRTNEAVSFEVIIERFDDQFSTVFGSNPKVSIPAWLTDVRKSVPMRFIETQRLLNPARSVRRSVSERARTTVPEYAVTEDSKHLIEIIRKKLAESATLSQSLDGTLTTYGSWFTGSGN